MLTTKIIHELLGIDEVFKAPNKLMEILFDKEKREDLFKQFLEYERDMSYEWFMQYFEEEQADRKNKKQDFTPQALSKMLSKIVGGNSYFEVAAGTGSIMIQEWQEHRNESPFTYKPSNYWYHVEELSDRAIPFLLFNMLIRGMNGIVVHGDALTREIKNVYFIQNTKDDYMKFSDLNVMPRNELAEKEFNVRKWIGDGIVHVESPYIEWR
ncbi:methylase [Streptococcus parauberis]|nr:methylase [Streptococcus parauberis]QBX18259.1 hypothetical protein Javan407_0026 [Streptococcus phage Javan407]